jgi:hypothetical protein
MKMMKTFSLSLSCFPFRPHSWNEKKPKHLAVSNRVHLTNRPFIRWELSLIGRRGEKVVAWTEMIGDRCFSSFYKQRKYNYEKS